MFRTDPLVSVFVRIRDHLKILERIDGLLDFAFITLSGQPFPAHGLTFAFSSSALSSVFKEA